MKRVFKKIISFTASVCLAATAMAIPFMQTVSATTYETLYEDIATYFPGINVGGTYTISVVDDGDGNNVMELPIPKKFAGNKMGTINLNGIAHNDVWNTENSGWNMTNIDGIPRYLTFDIKVPEVNNDFVVTILDRGSFANQGLNLKYPLFEKGKLTAEDVGKWTTVVIPMSEFQAIRPDYDLSKTKYVGFGLNYSDWETAPKVANEDERNNLPIDERYVVRVDNVKVVGVKPVTVQVADVSEEKVVLTWEKADDDTTSYQILRNGSSAPIATVPAGTELRYEDAEVIADTSYSYVVRSMMKNGIYMDSAPVSALTTNLSAPVFSAAAVPGQQAVKIDYTKPANGNITGYKVYRSDMGEDAIHTISGGDSGSWIDYTVMNNQTYTYTMRSLSNEVESKLSAPVTVTVEVLAVPELTVTQQGNGFAISWTEVDGAETYVLKKNGQELYSGKETIYTDGIVPVDEVQTYTVEAKNDVFISMPDEKAVYIPNPERRTLVNYYEGKVMGSSAPYANFGSPARFEYDAVDTAKRLNGHENVLRFKPLITRTEAGGSIGYPCGLNLFNGGDVSAHVKDGYISFMIYVDRGMEGEEDTARPIAVNLQADKGVYPACRNNKSLVKDIVPGKWNLVKINLSEFDEQGVYWGDGKNEYIPFDWSVIGALRIEVNDENYVGISDKDVRKNCYIDDVGIYVDAPDMKLGTVEYRKNDAVITKLEDGAISASINVTRYAAGETTLPVMITAYYKNGVLVHAEKSSGTDETIKEGESKILSTAAFTVENGNVDTVKSFVFLDMGSITPMLSEIKVLN